MKQDTKRTAAWYIGAQRDEVGDAAILVGDPARIERLAGHMSDVRFLRQNRGLQTVTGRRGARRVTASAFGMGAPIAAIVLHELFALGVRSFLRIGTAMAVPPAGLGDFVLADGAFRAEGTSATYAPPGFPAIADFELNTSLRARLAASGRRWHAGIFGSWDGFYTEMFALDGARRDMIDRLRHDIGRMRLVGMDMETSALLVAARILGARASTLCVATVDADSQEKIGDDEMAEAEAELFEVALDAVTSLPAPLQDDRI